MSIDWFTFLAQIINFLILVGLLRWFLYGPIVRAMQQREENIAAQLHRAEEKQREGQVQLELYEQKLREFDEERELLLRQARHDSDEQRKRLTSAAQDSVQQKRQEWLQAFERERESLLAQVQHQIGQLSASATRQVLSELADESLEQRMFEMFLLKLRSLDDGPREKIELFLKDSQTRVVVRSALAVPDDWRNRLRDAMRDEFAYLEEIEFEVAPELICGIELNAGGYGFGWNVLEFLRTMETEFDSQLKTRIGYR